MFILLGFALWLASLVAFAFFDKIWIRIICGIIWLIAYFMMHTQIANYQNWVEFRSAYMVISPWFLLILLAIKGCWVRYKCWRSK